MAPTPSIADSTADTLRVVMAARFTPKSKTQLAGAAFQKSIALALPTTLMVGRGAWLAKTEGLFHGCLVRLCGGNPKLELTYFPEDDSL